LACCHRCQRWSTEAPIQWRQVPYFASTVDRVRLGSYAVALCETCAQDGWEPVEYAAGKLTWKQPAKR